MPYGAVAGSIPIATQSIIPEAVKPEPCRRLGCSFALFRAGTIGDEHGEVSFELIDPDMIGFLHTNGDQQDICLVPVAWINDTCTNVFASLQPWFDSLHDTEKRQSFKEDQLRRRTYLCLQHRACLRDEGEG